MELLSGGEMLIRALADEGVEFLFGYPGGAVLHIYDAIFQQERVKHILVRHEQTTDNNRTFSNLFTQHTCERSLL